MPPIRVLIIGAGSRGNIFAAAVSRCPVPAVVAAVAEPIASKRRALCRKYLRPDLGSSPEDQEFADWRAFLEYETRRRERQASSGGKDTVAPGVDAVFVCVRDELHRDVVVGLAPLGLHVMCEKPLATTLADCLDIYRALLLPEGDGTAAVAADDDDNDNRQQRAVFSVGHVLRYTPHNLFLRKLLREDKVIGDVLSVVHTEPVGWRHFTHSYVRGNWRSSRTTGPSLLTKSCHDIDLLMWLLSAPVKPGRDAAPAHLPATISSTGRLGFFHKGRKPAAAGDATNCLSCPLGDDPAKCRYSAREIYLNGNHPQSLAAGYTDWPINVVVPEIDDLESYGECVGALTRALREDYDAAMPADEVAARNWFGRCVFESDNDVCDDQVVTLAWDDNDAAGAPGHHHAKTAVFHMVAQTAAMCQRRAHYYGTAGELATDSDRITVTDFLSGRVRKYMAHEYAEYAAGGAVGLAGSGHGGGDAGLARQFIAAVDAVKNRGWDARRAQDEFVGCTLEEAVRSHCVVFAAEEARERGVVVRWGEWAAERGVGEMRA